MSRSVPGSKHASFLAIGCAAVVVDVGMMLDARYPWLWAYLLDRVHPQEAQAAAAGPTHILFAFVDHFEPHNQATIDRWGSGYPAMASRHRDADGKHPQHSWFWFFSRSDGRESLSFLQQLARLSYDGFGDVELHLHHTGDTEPTFLNHIGWMIRLSQWTGAMVTAEAHPRTTFGFIHGMWALDNSRDPERGSDCGINHELLLLRRLGCYADFTHASWGRMHPRIVNRLYYATADAHRLVARFLAPPGTPVSARLRARELRVEGDAEHVSLAASPDGIDVRLTTRAEGVVEFSFGPQTAIASSGQRAGEGIRR